MKKAPAKIPVGVLGATGVIGQEYLRLLKDHPFFEVTFLAASEKNVGKTLSGLPVHNISDIDEASKKCIFLFSALPNNVAESIEIQYAEKGLSLLSHASCHRMKEDIPLIIPEINPHHLQLIEEQRKKRNGFIVSKPNCALMAFLLPLAPLHKQFQLEKVHVTTMQAISGAGNALSALDTHDNVIPFIAGEEEKIENEPQKILESTTFQISSHCNRVPTLHGHFACVSASFSKKPKLENIVSIWKDFPGLDLPSSPKHPLIYCEEEKRPQTRHDVLAENGMSISIGRLRACPLLDIRFVALSHNAIRGGAGGGVLTAELLYKRGHIC
jgi:aspartate-semialdehyde dehydrogenase